GPDGEFSWAGVMSLWRDRQQLGVPALAHLYPGCGAASCREQDLLKSPTHELYFSARRWGRGLVQSILDGDVGGLTPILGAELVENIGDVVGGGLGGDE